MSLLSLWSPFEILEDLFKGQQGQQGHHSPYF
jgi:hypothetical protein